MNDWIELACRSVGPPARERLERPDRCDHREAVARTQEGVSTATSAERSDDLLERLPCEPVEIAGRFAGRGERLQRGELVAQASLVAYGARQLVEESRILEGIGDVGCGLDQDAVGNRRPDIRWPRQPDETGKLAMDAESDEPDPLDAAFAQCLRDDWSKGRAGEVGRDNGANGLERLEDRRIGNREASNQLGEFGREAVSGLDDITPRGRGQDDAHPRLGRPTHTLDGVLRDHASRPRASAHDTEHAQPGELFLEPGRRRDIPQDRDDLACVCVGSRASASVTVRSLDDRCRGIQHHRVLAVRSSQRPDRKTAAPLATLVQLRPHGARVNGRARPDRLQVDQLAEWAVDRLTRGQAQQPFRSHIQRDDPGFVVQDHDGIVDGRQERIHHGRRTDDRRRKHSPGSVGGHVRGTGIGLLRPSSDGSTTVSYPRRSDPHPRRSDRRVAASDSSRYVHCPHPGIAARRPLPRDARSPDPGIAALRPLPRPGHCRAPPAPIRADLLGQSNLREAHPANCSAQRTLSALTPRSSRRRAVGPSRAVLAAVQRDGEGRASDTWDALASILKAIQRIIWHEAQRPNRLGGTGQPAGNAASVGRELAAEHGSVIMEPAVV